MSKMSEIHVVSHEIMEKIEEMLADKDDIYCMYVYSALQTAIREKVEISFNKWAKAVSEKEEE